MGTYLVTGAAGFIGSHTAQALASRGHHVVGLDNFNDYYSPQQKRDNILDVLGSTRNFECIEGDIRDIPLLKQIFRRQKFDAVIHLAAMAGVRASVDDPALYFDVNLDGTLNMLNMTRDFGRPHFIFASTSSVYGNTKTIPFVETDPADRPLAPYPASKRAAEMLGSSYCHLHGLDFTALRFFTVYGPRGRPDMMAYKLCESFFTRKQVPLFNSGRMHRDWTHVKDIVAGIVQATAFPRGYEVLNLGRGEPILLAHSFATWKTSQGRRPIWSTHQ